MKVERIPAPALEGDAKRPPLDNERIERAVVANLIHHMLSNGFTLRCVDDGGEEDVPTATLVEAMEAIFSVDYSTLVMNGPGAPKGRAVIFCFVLGNGHEVLSDCSDTNDHNFNTILEEFDMEAFREQY